VSARSDGAAQTVVIEATDPVAYTIKRPDPLTVLVDLRNVAVSAAAKRASQLPEGPVRAVSVEELTEADGNAVARVRLQLGTPAPHRVRSTRNTIRVEFARPDTDPSSGHGDAAPVAEATAAPPASTLATSLRAVSTAVKPGQVTVLLRGNGRLEVSRVAQAEDLPPRLVLDFAGVDAAAPAQTAGPGQPVTRVRVARNSHTPLVTRVVVDLDHVVPYHVERAGASGEDLAVVFETAAPASIEPAAPPMPEPASAPDPFSALTLVTSLTPPPARQSATPTPRPPAAPPARTTVLPTGQTLPTQQAPPARPAPAPETPAASQRYTGQAITMDFQDADLRAVLRTFAEISGLNMVIDPAVQGTVDVVLNEVPWDQALDIILRGSKLGYAVDGTVVRIAPLSVLAEEEAARRKLNDAQALAGDLSVMTKALSYAKADTLKDLVTRSALSQRGEVQVDARTNTTGPSRRWRSRPGSCRRFVTSPARSACSGASTGAWRPRWAIPRRSGSRTAASSRVASACRSRPIRGGPTSTRWVPRSTCRCRERPRASACCCSRSTGRSTWTSP
jgi:type IV pilus assembly protein PilQ